MVVVEQIDADLKKAMLAGETDKVSTLRGVKSAMQNEAIATGAQVSGLSEEQVQKVLARESKKRAEAAEVYKRGNAPDRAEKELAEKLIIDNYLPKPASEEEIVAAVEEELAKSDNPSPADMGKIIGAIRAKLPNADGGTIARIVKEKLG